MLTRFGDCETGDDLDRDLGTEFVRLLLLDLDGLLLLEGDILLDLDRLLLLEGDLCLDLDWLLLLEGDLRLSGSGDARDLGLPTGERLRL